MKYLAFLPILILTACTTTQYQTAPNLCPEPVEIVLPTPPSAVTDEPAAEDFLGRLLEFMGESK